MNLNRFVMLPRYATHLLDRWWCSGQRIPSKDFTLTEYAMKPPFSTLFIQPIKNHHQLQHLGLAPNPTHLRGRRGRWQNLSTYPYGECWVASKASRVKCTASPPLTPFQLCQNSQTIRSGRSRKPVKACEATA